MVYNVLNKLKWTEKLQDCKIIILHRGAPKNEKLILGSQITEIKKSYFMYLDERTGKEIYIPMHRVLRVITGGKILWKRRKHQSSKKGTGR